MQVDIDKDGMLDLMVTTSEGGLYFIDHKGNRIINREYQVFAGSFFRGMYSCRYQHHLCQLVMMLFTVRMIQGHYNWTEYTACTCQLETVL